MASWNTREDRMKELLNNKSILMALGDGGAHVDMLCDAGYPTYLLGTWVREKQAITLEEGVRKLTSDPADLFGLKDRGRLAKGAPADVAIFDPERIGSKNHGERRYDLPGGAKRIVMPSQRRRIHRRQRRADLGAGQAHRGQGGQGAARLVRQPHATRPHIPRIAIGEELALLDQGDEARQQHDVADLHVRVAVVGHCRSDDVRGAPPFPCCLFEDRGIEVIDRRGGKARRCHHTKRRVLAS